MKALKMDMEQSYKLRKYWNRCGNTGCGHLIAPEGYPKICDCNNPKSVTRN